MKNLIIFLIPVLFYGCSKEPGNLNTPNLQNNLLDPNDIVLELSMDSLVADGKTFAMVEVKVAPNVLKKYNNVNFNISPVGRFSNNQTTSNSTLDVTGKAHTFVVSDTQGLALIRINIGNSYLEKSIKFYKTDVDTLQLSITRNNAPADNYSYAEITAVTKKRAFANNQITFVTDHGTFTNGSNVYMVQASFNDTTKAYIKYNSPELVRVVATIYNTYSKEIYATFIPAFPSQILINPSVTSLPPLATSKTGVSALLVRPAGSVSVGQRVIFYDSSSTGKSVGAFFNTTVSDSLGKSTTEYSLQDTTFRGFLYIKAYAFTDTGKVTGINRILIQ